MSFTWTVGRKIGAGFALAGIALLVIAVLGYRNIHSLVQNDTWVGHTHQVRMSLADLLSSLKDAETGQRGYVITGNESFLGPYETALLAIDKSFDDVRKLTADNADQQRRLESARPLIDAKMAELKATIEQRRTRGFETAAQTVSGGEGKKLMDQVRRILADMDGEERGLLDRRRNDAEASAQWTKA